MVLPVQGGNRLKDIFAGDLITKTLNHVSLPSPGRAFNATPSCVSIVRLRL
jgi:hypothetical protein